MSDNSYFVKKKEITSAAEAYCELNELSVEKLHGQMFSLASNRAVFAQPQNKSANGIKDDINTLPTPVLIINITGNGYEIEETEQTRRVLAKG